MIAPIDEEPDPPRNQGTSLMKSLALWTVLPTYLIIAALIEKLGGRDSLFEDLNPFIAFVALAATGLAGALYSFRVRYALLRKAKQHDPEPDETRSIGFGMGLAELPASLGLLHFILFRDWGAFIILLMVTFVLFILHATDAGKKSVK